MIGIYRIKNVINNKSYYGSSKNIEKRWKRHKRELNNNKHVNCILQKAWNKYGEDNFIFEIIEECNVDVLLDTEQKYLNLLPEYNIGLKASGGDNLTKNPKRKNIIKKMTESVNNRFNSMTDEEKKEKYSMPLEKNPNWKGGVSYNHCKCGKRIGYGDIHCNKCRPRNNENNPFFGKKHSNDTKKHLSTIRKNTYNGDQNKPIIINNIEYRSYGEASKILGISITTIRWRVLSKNPKYINYNYVGQIKKCFSINEQSERMSKSQIGKKRNWNKSFLIDNIEYRTLKDASEILNIHPMTIKGRLLSKKFENYKYK